MQSSFVRKTHLVRPPPVKSGGETKQVRRKVFYRVGYSWNKGGRLKELRIRHLARKFLRIWMQHTFGKIFPHEARSHYINVTLRRAFQGWKDEWWATRREWRLTLRAECHYRYHLYIWVFSSWRHCVSLKKEKKAIMQNAQSFAEKRLMRLVWERWEDFTEIRRRQNRMLQSALEKKRLSSMHSVWILWQTRLQQQRDLYILESKALKQRALSLESKAWLLWRDMHRMACCQREKESKSTLHFILRLKRRTFNHWIRYVSSRNAKKKSKALAQRSCYLYLVRKYLSKWCNALDRKRSEETRLQAASHLAIRSTRRRALMRWRAYVKLCREESERNQLASQHFRHHLLCAGLEGLSLNVMWNKADRLNSNMAVQHCQQTMIRKYWKLWRDHLEEIEDQSFQPLAKMALTNYRIILLRSCFHHWREKLSKQRYMQELEHHADVWFKGRILPLCFNSWVKFTMQRKLDAERRHKAEVYNRHRQYTWVFYTWWGRSEKHKEEMLSERMAILYEERCHVFRVWSRWRQRTQQQLEDAEKQVASQHLYIHRLLHKSMMQWKDNSKEIRDRRNREQKANHQGDLRCMRLAIEKWKMFVQGRRENKRKLKEVQRYHEVKLLKLFFVAWKKHHLQMSRVYEHAEELFQQKTHYFLRQVLTVWREKAMLMAEIRLAEQQAQNHFQHVLQLKVILAWREETTRAVSHHHQQGEALRQAQSSISQVRLLRYFRQWRKQTREARRERMSMEKARQHHNYKLFSETLKAWKKHHYQHHKNKVMKRQGLMLLKLKMYQMYFEQWKIKLQHRQREAKQTVQALWHWSLTLQAKVLYGWRMWVIEQRYKREQAARVAQVYRDQLLREGVASILTYAAHMSDLTTSLTEFSQPQRSQSLQKVVKRCAMRWKQRALCRPRKGQEIIAQPPRKSVTFCLTAPAANNLSSSDSVDQEADDGVLSKHTQKESGLTSTEAALNPFEFSCPPHTQHPAVPSCRDSSKHAATSSHQCTFTSTVIPAVPSVDSSLKVHNQHLLLPPSAFMSPGSQNQLGNSSNSSPGKGPLMPFHQSAPPFKHQPSAYPDTHLKTPSVRTEGPPVENAPTDPVSALARELLNIQLDLKSFLQSREQLRAWRRVREVYQTWLQMSGEDEQMERKEICEGLKELEERIHRLSTELEKRKPTMHLHAERIQHLRSVLSTSGT